MFLFQPPPSHRCLSFSFVAPHIPFPFPPIPTPPHHTPGLGAGLFVGAGDWACMHANVYACVHASRCVCVCQAGGGPAPCGPWVSSTRSARPQRPSTPCNLTAPVCHSTPRARTGRPTRGPRPARLYRSKPRSSPCCSRDAIALHGLDWRRACAGRHTCLPPRVHRNRNEPSTPRAALATRQPSPSGAGGGPAPGGSRVRSLLRAAIVASRARPVSLAQRYCPPQPQPTEGLRMAAHVCAATGASLSQRDEHAV
jgi:hypothetical protein